MTLTAVLLAVGAIVYTLLVRERDLAPAEPASPARHLEERKAAVDDSLRDLQFEHRIGKLSDEDYQQTRQELERELAALSAEIEKLAAPVAAPSARAEKPKAAGECPNCGARFAQPMKFCGECGRPMSGEDA